MIRIGFELAWKRAGLAAALGGVLWLVGIVAIAPTYAHAEEKAFTFRPSRFDWVVENCEAEFLDDGVIVGKKGNGWVRSATLYHDFILELEWKPQRTGYYDAGVFFRAAAPPEGKPWPDLFQINLKTGAEGVLKYVDSQKLGEVKTREGDWNRLKLTVQGKTATAEINGTAIWKTTALEGQGGGWIALQVEEPSGGVIFYRNVQITELDHTPMLGEGLSGWEAPEGDPSVCWKREGEELVCTGAKGPWLRYAQPVKDFNLRLEYLLKEGGNSGVYVRVPADGTHHGAGSGIEVQILDDASPRYRNLKPYQYSGSLYAIVPADPRCTRSAGEWNSLEIDCRGDQYVVRQNGVEVIRTRGSVAPELLERRLEGYLGLQNHSEEVRFRHLRIGHSRQ